MRALTGAAAAALLGFDGFRDLAWSPLWTSPSTHRAGKDLIRTRHWLEPTLVEDRQIAHPILVLRHLGESLVGAKPLPDGITPLERIELAVEFALRHGLVELSDLSIRSSRSIGDRMLYQVLQLRGNEPPTESYAETRAIQILRRWGIVCWRQVWIFEAGRAKHRVDLVIPYRQGLCRPARFQPGMGLVVEVDSREFHEREFEKDHARQTTYDLLGFAWTSFTPNQLEHQENRCRRAIVKLLERGLCTTQLRKAS